MDMPDLTNPLEMPDSEDLRQLAFIDSNDFECRIFAFEDLTQLMQLEIPPGDSLIAEAGMSSWIDEGIHFETKSCQRVPVDAGRFGKLLERSKQKLSGSSARLTYFTNLSRIKRQAAFAAPESRDILPISLSEEDGDFWVFKHAFLCAGYNIEVSVGRSTRGLDLSGLGLANGVSPLLRLSGNGKLFVHTGGRFSKKRLDDETLRVDWRCILGFTVGIRCELETVSLMKSLRPPAEEASEATLRGTGDVYLQSKPYRRSEESTWLARQLRGIMSLDTLKPYMDNLEKMKKTQLAKIRKPFKKAEAQNRETMKKYLQQRNKAGN